MSPPSPLSDHPPSDTLFTASDLLTRQSQLEQEAAEAVPFSFTHCTYPDGPLRQPLYACRTCLGDAAVCAACSVSCHGEHELVELFVRRNFRCDCGTERMGAGSCCGLRVGEGRDDGEDMPPNQENKYDANFRGEFCWCEAGKTYDPQTETDAMYQCLVCENWMHNECLQGYPADSTLNPLTEDHFDLLVCQRCVLNEPKVRAIMDRYAGVPGSGVVLIGPDQKLKGRVVEPAADVPPAGEEGYKEDSKPVGWLSTKVEPPDVARETDGHEKRKLDSDPDEANHAMDISPKKKRRTSPSPPTTPTTVKPAAITPNHASTAPPPTALAPTAVKSAAKPSACRAPPLPPPGQLSVLEQVEAAGGRSNVWLEEGFYDRWCRCEECLPRFDEFPFLLEEETSYDPPEDPEAHKTMEELGMEALANLPRAQALDGVVAFQGLSERLKHFLRPHADAGEVITEDLIKQFFSEEQDRKLAR